MDIVKKVLCGCLIAMFMSLFSTGLAYAAVKNKDSKKNAQIIQQIRKQQAALQAELEAEKKTVADKEKALEGANRAASVSTKNLSKAKAELANLNALITSKDSEIERFKAELQELKQQNEKNLAALEVNEKQRKTLVQSVMQTKTRLNESVEKNKLLYLQAKSLIKIYEKQTTYESALRDEKFFQLKRVELENIFQDKLDDIENAKMDLN